MIEIYKQLFKRMAELEGIPTPTEPLDVLKTGELMISNIVNSKGDWRRQMNEAAEQVRFLEDELNHSHDSKTNLEYETKILKALLQSIYVDNFISPDSKKQIFAIANHFGITVWHKEGRVNVDIEKKNTNINNALN